MLELRDICFEVDGKHILNHINLTIEDHQLYVITGPNGGGKSTLAKIIMGIELPTSGQILFNGEDITHLTIDERAKRKMGYAFQQPPRFKGMSVRRLLQLAHGGPLPEECCVSYLSDVGLCSKDYLDRDVDGSLSGGEVKRIEIATLLARDLEVSIFDEPEAGIDLWSFAKLVETFQKLKSEEKQSIMKFDYKPYILSEEFFLILRYKIKI